MKVLYSQLHSINPAKKFPKMKCKYCESTFREVKYLNRHVKYCHNEKRFKCQICNYKSNINSNFQRHKKKHEREKNPQSKRLRESYFCDKCETEFQNQDEFNSHKKQLHDHQMNRGMNKSKETQNKDETHLQKTDCHNTQKCLDNSLLIKKWKNRGSIDIFYVLQKYKYRIMANCASFLKRENGIKFSITLKIRLKKFNEEIFEEVYFCGKMRRMTNIYEFDELFNQSKEKIWKNTEVWLREGSGWIIDKIDEIVLKVCVYKPYGRSSYIKSPEWVYRSNSVLNLKNMDNKCFLWHVIAALFPHPLNQISYYEKQLDKLNVKGIRWPMEVAQIEKFERQNNVSINVYSCENKRKEVWPLKISKRRDIAPINLLLFNDKERSHYTLIKDFNRLLSQKPLGLKPKLFCYYCLHGFDKRYSNEEKMKEHMDSCYTYGAQKIRLPKIGNNFIEFSNFHKMLKLPFIIFADFECLNIKCNNEKADSNTKKLTSHQISGYGYCVVSVFEETKFHMYRGPDAAEKFLKQIEKEKYRILDLMKKYDKVMNPLTPEQEKMYKNATQCHICKEKIIEDKYDSVNHLKEIRPWLESVRMDGKKLPSITNIKKQKTKLLLQLHPDKNPGNEEACKRVISNFKLLISYYQRNSHLLLLNDDKEDEIDLSEEEIEAIRKKGPKVRDHDHWTGDFRGAAHSGCNLLYRRVKKIPVFFHNLSGYDGHIIFETIPKLKLLAMPKLLSKSLEKFTVMSFGQIEFKDSLNFLSSSLESLVKDLRDKRNDDMTKVFRNTYSYFQKYWSHIDQEAFEMLTRKLVYPYEYMDSWSRMDETCLPDKNQYFSSLSGKHISDQDYCFAQQLWCSQMSLC